MKKIVMCSGKWNKEKRIIFRFPKNRKQAGAGGRRVRRASAGTWENLGVPKPRRTGQMRCCTHRIWGALRWELINNSCRIAPVPVRRGFGTVRFSTSLQPPAVHASHLSLPAFVRFFPKSLPQIFWHSQGSVIHLILSIMLIKLKHMRWKHWIKQNIKASWSSWPVLRIKRTIRAPWRL